MNNQRQYGLIDSLVITRNGNQLKAIEDYAQKHLTYTGASDFYDGYTYDTEYYYNANGALESDINRDIDLIQYDALGNTRCIYYFGQNQIEYIYAADGTKLRTIHRPASSMALTDSIDYIGNLILKNGQPSMYLFDGGYATFNSNSAVNGWHYYIQDYMENNRMVVNKNGTKEQITHYYPYGGVIGDISTNESFQNYKFEGKELDRTFGLDNYDIHARQYFSMMPTWDRIDPLAEKYYGISPYAYCGGDPVNRMDFLGKDWYSHEDSVEIDGQKYATIKYEYTDYKSQKELDDNGISGTYWGNILVVFNGHYDERLDNGRIIGEKAVNAEVTVYGPRGADDISNYIGYTMTSDFSTFGAIANGVYPVTWINKNSKGIPKHYAINNAGPVDCINGVNPAPDWSSPFSSTQKNGIYIHSTATGGRANWDYSKKLGKYWAISTGCLLILDKQWDAFEKQIGHNGFTLILNRQ